MVSDKGRITGGLSLRYRMLIFSIGCFLMNSLYGGYLGSREAGLYAEAKVYTTTPVYNYPVFSTDIGDFIPA